MSPTPRTLIAALLLAICLAGCAASAPRYGNDPRDGSRGTLPGIDYHAFPYDVQAG